MRKSSQPEPQPPLQNPGRVLARVLAEDLKNVTGAGLHTFTRGIEPGEYDLD